MVFKKLFDAFKLAGIDDVLLDIGDNMHELGASCCSLSHYSTNRKKADESKAKQIIDAFDKCVDGVSEIDKVIEELKAVRGMLVEDALALRNAFPSFKPDVTKRIVEMAMSRNGRAVQSSDVRKEVANFLGYETMPESIVNVSVRMIESEDVLVAFGVKDKPTLAAFSIPVVVDYADDYKIQNLRDSDDGLWSIEREAIRNREPAMMLNISTGAMKGGERTVRFGDVDDLRKAIDALLGFDVRDTIQDITDISKVQNAEEFIQWRMRRRANKIAAANKEDT